MHYILAIIVAVILYYCQAIYYEKHWSNNLSASISFSRAYANVGDTIQLTEQIKNEKLLPLPVLYVKFTTSKSFLFEEYSNASVSDHYHRNDIFSIMGRQQITRSLQFKTSKRGYYSIEHVNLVVNDLFLKHSYALQLDNHTSLYVYPALLTNRYALALTSSIIGDLSRKDLYEDPLSFRGIREYISGDSMRSINWKATAKHQELMVNTYYDTQNTEVVLLFNLDTNTMQRDTHLQEYIISVVATLLQHMHTQGIAIKLAINTTDPFSNEVITTDLGTGEEHLHSMLQILARLDLSKALTPFENFFTGKDSLFANKNNNTTYLIVSNYRKKQLLDLYNDKQTKGHKIQFVCPEKSALCVPLSDIQYWEVNANEL